MEAAIRQEGVSVTLQIAQLLTANQVGPAVALAAAAGDVRLAAIICQVP